jgi:uncharacterized protein (TIGR00255 family)
MGECLEGIVVRSMTGFGSAESTDGRTGVKVEISSVNGRYLDLKVKLPRYLNEYENELKKIAQEYIERGRVSLTVKMTVESEKAAAVRVDDELAARYIGMARELSDTFGIENGIDARTLLTFPDMIVCDDDVIDSGEMWDAARDTVISAFRAHAAMRDQEGEAIGRDVAARLASLGTHLREIERRIPEVVNANTARLRRKIEGLIGNGSFDEVRFGMEVALYADRIDITEECVRFHSHNALFLSELEQPKTSGRKLSFLLQEMNREANTIGSKIMDAGIAGIVVLIKEEIEKIREQTENIE